jgi:hypothetical protein
MDDTTLANIQLKAKDERQRQAIKMVRAARERRDLISKFCEIDLDSDGRMRCHYDPAKTDTSRLSSRKFYPTGNGANLQNVPRDTRVRAVFVPDRGYVFGYADLKSAESLVVAHITGDPEMLRLHSPEYMDGKRDGHKYVASFLLGKPIDQITKDDRYLGKRVVMLATTACLGTNSCSSSMLTLRQLESLSTQPRPKAAHQQVPAASSLSPRMVG